MKILKGYGNNLSWRKLMTAGAVICFMTAALGYLVTNNFDELPGTYQAIIAGVFAFYFGKDIIRNTNTAANEKDSD